MNNSSDIWFAFARTFSVLFLVLALLILVFYLIKRFSEKKGISGNKDFINVLSVHHLSPKEKLILLNVAGETLLIGVTPNNISKISKIEKEIPLPDENTNPSFGFSDFLAQKLGRSVKEENISVSIKDPIKKQVR